MKCAMSTHWRQFATQCNHVRVNTFVNGNRQNRWRNERLIRQQVLSQVNVVAERIAERHSQMLGAWQTLPAHTATHCYWQFFWVGSAGSSSMTSPKFTCQTHVLPCSIAWLDVTLLQNVLTKCFYRSLVLNQLTVNCKSWWCPDYFILLQFC